MAFIQLALATVAHPSAITPLAVTLRVVVDPLARLVAAVPLDATDCAKTYIYYPWLIYQCCIAHWRELMCLTCGCDLPPRPRRMVTLVDPQHPRPDEALLIATEDA